MFGFGGSGATGVSAVVLDDGVASTGSVSSLSSSGISSFVGSFN